MQGGTRALDSPTSACFGGSSPGGEKNGGGNDAKGNKTSGNSLALLHSISSLEDPVFDGFGFRIITYVLEQEGECLLTFGDNQYGQCGRPPHTASSAVRRVRLKRKAALELGELRGKNAGSENAATIEEEDEALRRRGSELDQRRGSISEEAIVAAPPPPLRTRRDRESIVLNQPDSSPASELSADYGCMPQSSSPAKQQNDIWHRLSRKLASSDEVLGSSTSAAGAVPLQQSSAHQRAGAGGGPGTAVQQALVLQEGLAAVGRKTTRLERRDQRRRKRLHSTFAKAKRARRREEQLKRARSRKRRFVTNDMLWSFAAGGGSYSPGEEELELCCNEVKLRFIPWGGPVIV